MNTGYFFHNFCNAVNHIFLPVVNGPGVAPVRLGSVETVNIITNTMLKLLLLLLLLLLSLLLLRVVAPVSVDIGTPSPSPSLALLSHAHTIYIYIYIYIYNTASHGRLVNLDGRLARPRRVRHQVSPARVSDGVCVLCEARMECVRVSDRGEAGGRGGGGGRGERVRAC